MKQIIRNVRMLALAGVVVCGLGSVWAGEAVWTGGSGAWSEPTNWRGDVLPQSGDTVYVSNDVANVTIDVDVVDVSLAAIRLEGAGPVKLTGNALTLTGGFSIKCVPNLTNVLDFPICTAGFLALVDVDCDVPLVFAPPSGNCGICVARVTVDFRRKVSCTGSGYFYVHAGAEQSKFGTLNFHDEVDAPDATLRPNQHPTGIVHFQAPVTFKTVMNSGWSGQELHFHATGSDFPRLQLDYGNKTQARVQGAYPENLVVALGNTHFSGNDAGIFNLGNFDTTIDRLGEDVANSDGTYLYNGQTLRCGMVRSTANIDGSGTAKPVTLTMNATASAQTTMMVMDAVSLVWNPTDDFTLAMLGRAHPTTGSIDVRRGTLCLTGACSIASVPAISLGAGARLVQASTLANALAGLERLTLGAGARAEFAAAVENCPKAVVTLGAGAQLALPAGTELHVAAVCANGAYVANGEYEGVGWIDGAGKVVVDSGTIAFWKAAVDGNWSDATKWADGSVPGATCTRVCFTMSTADDYVVTVDEPIDALKGDLLVGNDGGGLATLRLAADLTVTQATVTVSKGGLIDVPTGTTFTFIGAEGKFSSTGSPSGSVNDYPASERRDILIRDGGEWRTSGGTTVITNFCGKFQVSGASQESVGKFSMTSGTVIFMDHGSLFPLTVLPNGQVDFTGGIFCLPHNGYNHLTDLANSGGLVRFKDTEVNTAGAFFHKVGGSIVLGSGETRFEGTAVLKVVAGSKSLKPSGPGETATLTFADGAQLPSLNANVPYVACGNEGRAVINWNSGDSGENCYFVIGANKGYGELNVNSGKLKTQGQGLKVGAYNNGVSALNNIFGTASGRVTVKSGATIEVSGSLDSGWSATKWFSGLVVGEGMGDGLAKSDARYVYEGCVEVFGSLVQNLGNAAVGLGRAKGTLVVDGGTATFQKQTQHDLTGQTVVGMGGGYGRVVVSNGVFETQNGNLYVGGCLTDDLQAFDNKSHVRTPWVGDATYPADLRDADGQVSVVNGSVTVKNATVLGKDGVGAIEMIGSAGSFTTKDLELCAGASTLKYVADLSGVAPVKVTGSLTIGEGAAIDVDARSLVGKRRRFKVIDTADATVTGAFSLANVNVLGVEPTERIVLRTAADGVYVSVSGGGCVIFR